MQASSLARRIRRCVAVRDWAWWQLPPVMRGYVAAPIVAAAVVIVVAGARTDWRAMDLVKFLLLVSCGVISVASTPRMAYINPGVTRDFSTIWALPTAILLPPVYAAIAPITFMAVLQIWVNRGTLYKRVFTCASISLCCVVTSLVFRCFPASFAGGTIGSGLHAFTWTVAVAACEFIGGRLQHFMIVGAIKLANPEERVWSMEWDREALQGLFVEIDLGVLITLAVGLSPALVLIAAPTVLLVRRYLVHPLLLAQSRVDAKTGLLNIATWESEAEGELSRAVRNRDPLSLILVDIDHFKVVNDTYGHLAGDRVLKSLAETLTGQSRDYDRAGRFGGEEFVLLLAQTTEHDACNIAERLRCYVASLEIPSDDRQGAPAVKVTISIGVTALARGESYELTDLLAAADSAMYAAKQAGRNQVAFAAPLRDMGLDAAWNATTNAGSGNDGTGHDAPRAEGSPLSGHRVVLVQTEQTAASLCARR
jgi:diguanylate cyclase (GGDEF)-like protein